MATSHSGGHRLEKDAKYLFAMVGLPARGKSFLSAKIVTFFNWQGISSRIFNAGSRRRDTAGASESGRSIFFSSENGSAVSKRDEIAMNTLAEAVRYLKEEGGSIAIFDATNTTKTRRAMLNDFLKGAGVEINLIFIESICNDESVLVNNRLQKVTNSPDFKGMTENEALSDLKKRISEYEKVYEPLDDDERFPYIKLIDLASKVVCNRIWGAIPMKCVQLLMSCHVGKRPVYLVRAGHCEDVDDLSRGKWISENVMRSGAADSTGTGTSIEGSEGPYASSNKGGGSNRQQVPSGILDLSVKMPSTLTSNARLSESGKRFSQRLARYIQQQDHGANLTILSSTMPRAVETALALDREENIEQFSSLGILDTGICHGMSVQSIKDQMPEEYAKWAADKLRYRFPGGESILDMNKRLAETILEIEHYREAVLVVSHHATLQSVACYFTGKEPSEIPYISIPQHSVGVLQPSIYGWSFTTVIPEG